MRLAFDIGGVISKYPELFRELISTLEMHTHFDVLIISDMPREKILEILTLNRIGVTPENVYSADYETHGEGCKAELLRELKVDMFFDDHLGYVAAGGCPVRFLMMPDASRPYVADTWKTLPSDHAEFGRVRYKK